MSSCLIYDRQILFNISYEVETGGLNCVSFSIQDSWTVRTCIGSCACRAGHHQVNNRVRCDPHAACQFVGGGQSSNIVVEPGACADLGPSLFVGSGVDVHITTPKLVGVLASRDDLFETRPEKRESVRQICQPLAPLDK